MALAREWLCTAEMELLLLQQQGGGRFQVGNWVLLPCAANTARNYVLTPVCLLFLPPPSSHRPQLLSTSLSSALLSCPRSALLLALLSASAQRSQLDLVQVLLTPLPTPHPCRHPAPHFYQ